MELEAFLPQDNGLELLWSDGQKDFYSYLWLLDNAADRRDGNTDQKLFSFSDMLAQLEVPQVKRTDQYSIQLTWPTRGHTSVFQTQWLRQHSHHNRKQRKMQPKHWKQSDATQLPVLVWKDILASEEETFRALDLFVHYGFLRVSGVPVESGSIKKVVEHFGYVRETNYGMWFDVKTEANPSHLAYTNLALTLHTDNAYREATPSVQLLHSLKNGAQGGESLLLDGFAALSQLRLEHPEEFTTLTQIPVPFQYENEENHIYYERPLVKLDYDNDIEAFHFNERMARALQVPPDDIERFYKAYKQLTQLLSNPASMFQFRLNPGDCLFMNNLRILHGRTAIQEHTGARHFQGCYADIDQFLSRYRVLKRKV